MATPAVRRRPAWIPAGGSARARLTTVLAAFLVVLHACGGDTPTTPDDGAPVDTVFAVPPRGTSSTLDVATWNLEFFGSPTAGPTDEGAQLRRIRDVVRGADLDLWGVQEVTGESAFADLVSRLPGYAGLLANDPAVERGAEFYSDFGGTEQKVGLLYRTAELEVRSARIILTELDHEFAGRPPLEVRVRGAGGAEPADLVVIVLHAKASGDADSWERRSAAAAGLKAYLDATWPDTPVLVLGDFNDDVDASITPGRDTPYRPFIADGANWRFLTAPLSAAGATSFLGRSDVIDHILASDEVAAWYEEGSAEVLPADTFVPAYRETTSDHLPVLARLRPAA